MCNESVMFVDRRCDRCGRKYGFRTTSDATEWPPCPHCKATSEGAAAMRSALVEAERESAELKRHEHEIEAGRSAFAAGTPYKACPHPARSPAAKQWCLGWQQAQMDQWRGIKAEQVQ